ncbi:glutamyl-tRNA amidotransferase subunit C [Mycoplasmopsis columbina SF7]|uniref:Glutamyl-tRNA amidotransferase subunit C n=1 Tax=Mycoplasmopsis columbina SF7 TaxID=1037410 RepID=F9UJG1_9BACT|nr:Asp-tRNA(Asn)/Glu-tRNA(Gln) amidotransferase subunit GatC [Mycoplasmopsis columbina]EGV00504.1 glutamyl-tRNA amidotransferase subunit C [Mycoplasmopsis columbina SF7]
MNKINKDSLKSIVSSIMLEPKEEVLDGILKEWNVIEENLKLLDKLNLENIEPMTHIGQNKLVDFFREDVIDMSFAISKESALKNAKESDSDYIVTKKVVK